MKSILNLFFLLLVFCTLSCKESTEPVPFVPIPGKAQYPVYYVSTTGNDSNTKLQAHNINTPWKTINASATKLIPGDTLYVLGGTYVEVVSIQVSGTSTKPIVISASKGQFPVIDGQNTLPTTDWTGLVNIDGNYVHISGFEVKNSGNYYSRGVNLGGHHNTVSNFNVHHVQDNGILIQGDDCIVEDSRVWQSCYNNVNNVRNGWASGLSSARDKVNGITDNAIIRRNIVYNNWGEGLSTYESQGTLIEDNIVYDNYAQTVYISDASNVMFRRNLVYNTPNNVVGKQIGAALADEVSKVPRSDNNKLINNIFFNVDLSAFSWTIVTNSGLTNALIANNTFVNSKLNTGNINSNNRIVNNIFTISGSVSSATGIIWSNNLWQGSRPIYAYGGSSDVFGDPLISKVGTFAPGELKADYFKLNSGSPALNMAKVLTEVTNDYFLTPRKTTPNIGAIEN